MVCDNCDDNADCKDGKCVCKQNYTGDGTSCEQVAGKLNYTYLVEVIVFYL